MKGSVRSISGSNKANHMRLYTAEHIRLVRAFDRYIERYPAVLEKIPAGAIIIMTKEGDSKFNRHSFAMLHNHEFRSRIIEARHTGRTWRLEPLNAKLLANFVGD